MIFPSPVLQAAMKGIIKVEENIMSARAIERTMNCLLSILMAAFFIVLAPLWTVFYGSLLLRDYLAAIKA
jgi:hypothetical protein